VLLRREVVTVIRIGLLCAIALPLAGAAQRGTMAPRELPANAVRALDTSLESAAPHARHVWRDTPPVNGDGTVNAYIEIARGDRRKWEFEMAANARAIDRVIPDSVGGYPVNYGFVPQTISYDGDPFDALVIGPPIEGGTLVAGVAVGVMFMEDEKGLDSKVVLSRVDKAGRPVDRLTPPIERELSDYFGRYKLHQPGAFSRVPGWGAAAEGLSLVRLTHAFFRDCRGEPGVACRLTP